jgi:hypothetical protein
LARVTAKRNFNEGCRSSNESSPDGAEEIFFEAGSFLSLLPELFPLGAFTHSSRCGLLPGAAPQLENHGGNRFDFL